MLYKIKTKVKALEEKKRVLGSYKTEEIDGIGKPVYEQEEEILGWFVQFDGSLESLFLGMEKPGCKVGQQAILTIEFRE